MAMAIKPDEATIIKKEMIHDFVGELCNNKVTKEYWNDCAKSREYFSASDVAEMKKLCNGMGDK